MLTISRTALIAAALLAQVPAFAQQPSLQISYADLDLTSANGRQSLDRRIQRAAQQLCGHADPRDVATAMIVRKCIASTRDQARPAVELAQSRASSAGTRLAN